MILNRQRSVRVARPPLELFLRRVQDQLGLIGTDVTICLVSDPEIARMNESFRKKRGPTDVLSFPAITRRTPLRIRHLEPGDAINASGLSGRHDVGTRVRAERLRNCSRGQVAAENPGFLGDIAISPAAARRNAKKYDRTLSNELRILILHGVLHLLGYDHETDQGQMERLERRLRRRLGLT
jgi:probable rRNA maturation factor